MDDRTHGLNHGHRRVGLEDVSSHVHAGRALVHGAIGHGQGVELGKFLASGDDDWHGTSGGDFLEARLDIVRLDVVRPDFSRDAGCQR